MAMRGEDPAMASLSEAASIVSAAANAASERHFFSPQSLNELTGLLAKYPQARLLAGGTDLAQKQ